MSESNLMQEKGQCAKLEKELDEMKKENRRWELKIADLDTDLNVSFKSNQFLVRKPKKSQQTNELK